LWKNAYDIVRRSVSGNVVVGRLAAEKKVANATADKKGLITLITQLSDNSLSVLFYL
jgi:hypothetical protein